jgi:hypothetical protein
LEICANLSRERRRHKTHDDRIAIDVGRSLSDLAMRIERDAVGGGTTPGQTKVPVGSYDKANPS